MGLPGLALAAWVRTLREPPRGGAEGLRVAAPGSERPFAEFLRELRAVLPPLTLWTMATEGGAATVLRNLLAAAAITAGAFALTRATGDAAQWGALGIGLYAATSWMQALRIRSPEAAAVILDTSALRWAALGFGFLSFAGYGIGYWVPPYFMRERGVSAGDVGLAVGGVAAAAGWLGVSLGGALADSWRGRSLHGRLYTGMLTACLTPAFLAAMLHAPGNTWAFVLNAPLTFVSSAWIGAGIATVHDLVPPRLRGSAGAAYLLVVTFIGLALGPYTMGKLSALLGGLGPAVLAGAIVGDVLAVACLLLAARTLRADQDRADRRSTT